MTTIPFRELPLTNGKVALVDEDDFRILSAWKWYADERPDRVYARTGHIYLHRVILGLPPGRLPLVDHWNGNGLDCRKANLRVATPRQNTINRKLRCDNQSGLCGVRWRTDTKKWAATIACDGVKYTKSGFVSEIEAARYYDDMARTLFGEFACLNFPRDGETGMRRD
jgi:hypothetical protein